MNVTVSLPDELIREARHEAVDRGLSLSRYVAVVLEEQIEARRRRRAAWEEHRRLMDEVPIRGIAGRTWTRDDLHGR